MIVNTIERDAVSSPKLDMNMLDTTKILASTSRGANVYDIRNLSKRLFTQENQLGVPTQCLWSPHRELVFASASADRHVYITDMGEVDRHSMNDYMSIQQSLIVFLVDSSSHMRATKSLSKTWTGTRVKTSCLFPTTKTV